MRAASRRSWWPAPRERGSRRRTAASDPRLRAAKARAVLQGRDFVSHDDIRAVALPVLRHRLKTNFNAEAEGITPDEIVRRLIQSVPEIAEDGKRGATPAVCKTA